MGNDRLRRRPARAPTSEPSVWMSSISQHGACARRPPGTTSRDGVDEEVRTMAIDRLHELARGGSLSLERFSAVLEQVLAVVDHTDLEAVMLALPPSLVRVTPASHRLGQRFVLQADGDLTLGSGWQLAADTTISVAFGTARLDLAAASWDANQINLRLETRGGRWRLSSPKVWSCRWSEGQDASSLNRCRRPSRAGRCCGSPPSGQLGCSAYVTRVSAAPGRSRTGSNDAPREGTARGDRPLLFDRHSGTVACGAGVKPPRQDPD